jgi:hypothetical protein
MIKNLFYCFLFALVTSCSLSNMPQSPVNIPVAVDDIREDYRQPAARDEGMIGEIQFVDIPRNFNAAVEVVDSADRPRIIDFPYAQRFN